MSKDRQPKLLAQGLTPAAAQQHALPLQAWILWFHEFSARPT